jgi:glycerol uptake facilitator-like aquaporin
LSLSRRLAAEGLGTALLLAVVVGSGIMGEQLAGGNLALALLANTLATGAGLFVLISLFAPLSGAHFNPVVSLVAVLRGELTPREAAGYGACQVGGAVVGVIAAHAMFGQDLLQVSQHARDGFALMVSEFVATFGLLLTILGVSSRGQTLTAASVGLYITAAYWFTASTSFANPAVALARSLTDTFAGIAPVSAPGFIFAEITGALAAWAVARWLFAGKTTESGS